MRIEQWLRLIAGAAVLTSVALGTLVHPGWYALAAVVAFNLIQSAFTRWCPMMTLLRAMGVRE